MRLQKGEGFTLIEILTVVAVLALIVGITFMNLIRAKMTANDKAAQATLKIFASACEAFATENGSIYPLKMTDLTQANPPFFHYDITVRSRQGYSYAVEFGSDGYTVTATPVATTGSWAYQIRPGFILRRSKPGEDNWALF
jgi:prepilin-type N-terminal cleavage/methylation domain-containing protein